ncbi:MAG: hypothetical protein JOZ38_12255 [Candidatus Eremiobacteraeota bacterium]|nr:hypothetical protein [Candidatus Eremiobacteraeota bacterium]
MTPRTFGSALGALALGIFITACGGGGGSALPTVNHGGGGPIPNDNSLTTFSVYTGKAGTQNAVDVQPFGQPSTLTGATLATSGAYVVYPDNSVQQVDAMGNFDASKSTWAMSNVNILAANPANEPTVNVFVSSSVGAQPESISVVAYAPGGPLVLADDMVDTQDAVTGSSADLAHVTVFPAADSVQDNRTKMFHVAGRDSNGTTVVLNRAPVTWSVTRANGCGSAAGSIRVVSGDKSTALYVPPAHGSVSGNCPDIVVASVADGSSTLSSSAAAFFYDPATMANLAGTLKTSAGQPAANAVINLYGGGPEIAHGSLLAQTDANGKFSQLIPTNRTLEPIAAALSADKSKASYVAVNPASLNPLGMSAAQLAAQAWSMTGAPASIAPPPQPPYEDLVRDASYWGNIARESFPFGAPNASGSFNAGSIEAILSAPAKNASGSVTSGPFAGYHFAWDASGTIATFTQPVSSNAQVLAVTIKAAKVNGVACAASAACFSYTEKVGTSLLADGTWSQSNKAGKFNVTMVRNEYNASHQTAGKFLYSELLTIVQTDGSQTMSLSDAKVNSANKPLGSLSASRTAGVGGVLYTYSGTAHALSYKSDGSTIAVDYTIENGVDKADYSGSFGFVISDSPVASDKGDACNMSINAPANANSSQGTIDGVRLSGLVSGHAASFTIAQSGLVSLIKDASLGGGTETFHL